MKYVIGMDIGGTNIKSGILKKNGKIIYKISYPTDKSKTPKAIIAQIEIIVDNLLKINNLSKKNIIGIGIGSPGPLNSKTGIVESSPNLVNWNNVPLRKTLAQKLSMKIDLYNDANAAAWGEFWLGAGEKASNFILVTLGTGVGGGIILNKKLYTGIDGKAGELGHTTIIPNGPLCGCGNRGCVEALASASSLIKRTKSEIKKGKKTTLNKIKLNKLTSMDIFFAAKKGDNFSKEMLKITGCYLGILSANLINTLNPEIIAFGGGLSQAEDFLFKPLIAETKKRALAGSFKRVKIIPATLGNDAGFIGAAGLLLHDNA